MRSLSAVGLLVLGSCSALPRFPSPPVVAVPDGVSASALLARAEANLAQRPDPAAVRRAIEAYLGAAQLAPTSIDGLCGAVAALAWLVEHSPDAAERSDLAGAAVSSAQECARRAPKSARCEYALATALGVHAREHPTTALARVKEVVAHLKAAAELDPRIDHGGPDRVLALVLVRAPGWPTGPGDPEAAVAHAQKALALFPDYAFNQVVLAEALVAAESPEARSGAERALASAQAAQAAGEPDAIDWVKTAQQLLERLGPG